ncbi:MAG: UMP kinase [Candidatus Bathyarchaeota archaeon]|nr:UMP kinase [Candidatus Bathyarchaeota archaeon]
MKTFIISLGGSIIIPDKINTGFLKKFKKLILSFVKKGHRFILVTGGGRVNREFNKAAREITRVSDRDLDFIGIAATRMNAELIRVIFSDYAYGRVVYNPTKKIKTNKKIIIGAGFEPGCSSDKDAVILAKQFRVKEMVNLFDKDYVYDKDPDEYKGAKSYKELKWHKYLKIIGKKWSPRLSTPFDPEAAKSAKKFGIKVVILKGTNLNNLKKYLQGKKFKGTVVG